MTATAWARRAGLALIVPAVAAGCGSSSGSNGATASGGSSSTGSVAAAKAFVDQAINGAPAAAHQLAQASARQEGLGAVVQPGGRGLPGAGGGRRGGREDDRLEDDGLRRQGRPGDLRQGRALGDRRQGRRHHPRLDRLRGDQGAARRGAQGRDQRLRLLRHRLQRPVRRRRQEGVRRPGRLRQEVRLVHRGGREPLRAPDRRLHDPEDQRQGERHRHHRGRHRRRALHLARLPEVDRARLPRLQDHEAADRLVGPAPGQAAGQGPGGVDEEPDGQRRLRAV